MSRGCVLAVGAAVVAGCGSSALPTFGHIPNPKAFESVHWEPVGTSTHPAQGAFLTFDGSLTWHGSDGCTDVTGPMSTSRSPDGSPPALRTRTCGTRDPRSLRRGPHRRGAASGWVPADPQRKAAVGIAQQPGDPAPSARDDVLTARGGGRTRGAIDERRCVVDVGGKLATTGRAGRRRCPTTRVGPIERKRVADVIERSRMRFHGMALVMVFEKPAAPDPAARLAPCIAAQVRA